MNTTDTQLNETARIDHQVILDCQVQDVVWDLENIESYDFNCNDKTAWAHVTAWAWLEGLLDWDYLINRRGQVLRHVLTFTLGGPHIWAEITHRGDATVFGEWGGARTQCSLDASALASWLTERAEESVGVGK
jgi:hypothetical protein